jgi:hypothetical protein
MTIASLGHSSALVRNWPTRLHTRLALWPAPHTFLRFNAGYNRSDTASHHQTGTPLISRCGSLVAYGEVKTPVIALHETALGILELAFLDQGEPQLAADRVRWDIVNRWEGVQEPMLAVRPGHGNGLFGRHACNAPSLEPREHLPPDLIDRFTTPGALPVGDRPDPLAAGLQDNFAYPGRAFLCEPKEAGVALGNLLLALGAAQMPGHLRVPHQLLQERQVALAPRLETHGALVGPLTL